MAQNETKKLPTIYIPHGGGPCFFMDWTMGPANTWDNMRNFLADYQGNLKETPKALLVVSAHWEEAQITVNANPNPPLLFDYYGFPEHTYQLKYDAPGSPQLADRVAGLLSAAGFPVRLETKRGFDHGIFVPLKVMFPAAEIPIVQLSLKQGLDPAEHLRIGRALEALRSEGVLIIGSGMSYHNMRGFGRPDQGPVADTFDAWLTSAVTSGGDAREQALAQWEKAPAGRMVHPREEHLLPLMVVAGAAHDDAGQKVFSDVVMGTRVSAFQFGEP
jgi:aromatic ring-opening dioxygenase catalytic subunit (LigB family)